MLPWHLSFVPKKENSIIIAYYYATDELWKVPQASISRKASSRTLSCSVSVPE